MCTNVHWITNKYSGTRILVSCGRCKACRQEKANKRATRLKNEHNSSNVGLFVTLTYDRWSCPYILHDDVLNNIDPLPVYRDCSFRRDPITHRDIRTICRHHVLDLEGVLYDKRFSWLPYLKKTSGHKVGVCIFKDAQDFKKRLRENLRRLYGFKENYKVYVTFEYGPETQRPHLHLLVFVPSAYVETFKSAIVQSWPFADRDRTRSNVQVARDAASYVASYVNCGSKLPSFIEANFPPKHSFSHGLGCGRDSFQYSALLENVQRQNMSYNLQSVKDGVPCTINLPIPKYVINRFFPLFKGYSRLTPGEVYDLLSAAGSISKVYDQIKRIDDSRMRLLYHYELPYCKREQMISWTIEDMFKIGTMLHNSFCKYKRLSGKSAFDYAIEYQQVWNCYKDTIIKRFMLDTSEPTEYRYDNILDNDHLVTPNRLARSNSLEDLYNLKEKTRHVNNVTFSQIYDDV